MEDYFRDASVLLKQYISFPNKDLKWWIRFRPPQEILENHPTFLYCEIMFYIIGFLTLLHALRNGGRYPWLWVATVLHGLTVECVSYFLVDIDNFWHAQSMVMLLGQRLPLHILFVYPAFIYTASVAVSHMNLSWWAEPFGVGLGAVLLDIPFDIMGVKLLWWTWHDDDPNIFDRHYWVPWTSYYFHAAFSSSFALVFHGVRTILCRREFKFQSAGFFYELLVAVVTGLLSMPLGILQFAPVYHPLHDMFGIHSEICVLLLICLYILIVWSADRRPFETARITYGSRKSKEIVLAVLLHYGFYMYLVLFSKPEKTVSIGYHQPVGPCGKMVAVHTPFGQVLSKTRFLCTDAYFEEYFDFHCVTNIPGDGKRWYTVCGTPFPNHMEYIVVVSAFCTVGLYWYWQLLLRSGPLPRTSARAIRVKHEKRE